MKAVGYFREAPECGQTLAQQNKLFLEFCDREGYEVAGTFADGASSNGRAPGFRQLVAFLREREGAFHVVVVPSMETLGGDVRDAAVRYFQIEGLGAQLASMDGTADASAGLLSAWTTHDDGNKLSDRVRAAMRRKAVKGEVLGRPPYGYKVGNRRRLELIPEEAVVVRYIYRLYLHESMGIRLIARRLNEEGLKTRRGGNWSMVSIRDILRNRAYLGTYSRFGVRVPGSHPSLVANDDFKLVQDRLNARRTSYSPRVTSQFLLSGMAHCGYCGNKLIGVSRKQTWKRKSGERVENSYRYYQCESRTNQSVCSYHTRRAEDLEAEVRASIETSVREGHGLPPAANEASLVADKEHERERLASRVRAVDKRLEGYVEAAVKGRLTKEKMHELSVAAASDRLRLEDALELVERRITDREHASDRKQTRERDVARLVREWSDLRFAERQNALREAVSRVTVSDDRIDVTLRP
ncbi:MAG: recombinase family protein [Dehalococcoidia bacterium]